MRLRTKQVNLNSVQLALLPVIADLVEENIRTPTNQISINPYQIAKILPFDKQTIKVNILKLKELSKNVT